MAVHTAWLKCSMTLPASPSEMAMSSLSDTTVVLLSPATDHFLTSDSKVFNGTGAQRTQHQQSQCHTNASKIYCSHLMSTITLDSNTRSFLSPSPSQASRMLVGEKMAIQLGQRLQYYRPKDQLPALPLWLCHSDFTHQCLSFPICQMRRTITTYLSGRGLQTP